MAAALKAVSSLAVEAKQISASTVQLLVGGHLGTHTGDRGIIVLHLTVEQADQVGRVLARLRGKRCTSNVS